MKPILQIIKTDGEPNILGHGGSRPGSGAKLKYGEPTTPVVIRVPKSKVKEFRASVKVTLKQWEV